MTTEEYQKGLTILHEHDNQKCGNKVYHYLLRGIHWMEEGGKRYKLFGSTPSGNTRSYSYYVMHTNVNGKNIHVPCGIVDEQIPGWIERIEIDPSKIAHIRRVYQAEIKRVTHEDRDETIAELNRQLLK